MVTNATEGVAMTTEILPSPHFNYCPAKNISQKLCRHVNAVLIFEILHSSKVLFVVASKLNVKLSFLRAAMFLLSIMKMYHMNITAHFKF
jgi:hypothetical protein